MDLPALPAAPPPAPVLRSEPPRGPRTTSKRVLFTDKVAGAAIRSGGLLVIVALLGILAFLTVTVIPLFKGASFEASPTAGGVPVEGTPRFVALDEYRLLAAAVGDKAEVVVFRPDDPREVIARLPVPGLEGSRVTTAHRTARSDDAVLGTADGRLALLDVGFTSDFLLDERLPALRAEMHRDEIRTLDGGVIQRVAGGNLLRVRPRLSVRAVLPLPGAGAVRAAGYAKSDDVGVAVAVTGDRKLWVARRGGESGGDGAATGGFEFVAEAPEGPAVPAEVFAALVDEEARTAWLVGRGGGVLRLDVTDASAVRREVKTVPDEAGKPARLTAADLLIGGRTLILGDDGGFLSAWSLVTGEATTGGKRLERFHVFDAGDSPVTTISCSALRRDFVAGHADGTATLCFAPNARVLGQTVGAAGPVAVVALGPKDDGMLVVGPGGAYRGFTIHNPHPETNYAALFQKVHYEGYDAPDWKYQSSAATQDAEMKISLTPLLFGTLKGTFYAMLFALPLALLAALYTSQFMHRNLRAVVKPGIEVMASLPSVVLGFLAALVIAPAVERVVPGVFASLVILPLIGLLAGCVWHVMPVKVKYGTSSQVRLLIALGLAATAVAVGVGFHRTVADVFFGGDFKAWLRGDAGYGTGTALLRLGLFFLGAAAGFFLLPKLRFARLRDDQSPRARAGLTLFYALAPGLLLLAGATWIESWVFGGDFRRTLIGDGTVYDQRNSLVVGIAMGFAVIPIIYTIAEDAMFAIPDSLKSASLACGASPWQTATRVVLPAAVPGVFSAVMIGLGRAIGETMIVVMATGGTAIIDPSMFNGFRTLSANIATELPEAPVDGTLFRVLFLAALLLFVLTFVVNTVAEIVRMRFRAKFRGL